MRSRAWLGLSTLAALAAVSGGACHKPKSFIVLNMHSADERQISGVTRVVVNVSQPASSLDTTLTYPVKNGPLVINQTNVNDLSVSFTGGRSGPVVLDVDVYDDAQNCKVGTVQGASVSIRQGDVVSSAIDLEALSCETADGGVDAPEGDAFPGCDPAEPGLVCASTETCQVDCKTNKGECTAGGTGGAGAPCAKNLDCAPGLQCFDYSGTGCAVKICLRFCNGDDACGSGAADAGQGPSSSDAGADGGAAAPGPRSLCQGQVPCGDVITAYHTCTFACDPRQLAVAAGATRCPAGLSCLVIGSMDQVDCACAEASRTGKDGDDCTGGASCAPGYICNSMADTKKCRAICRCDAKDGACTAANECGGKGCTALTNETTFGVCL
ncbi:MAG TPA: hypothetical protein VHL80_09755 [Polyangia bacterium]|nr:hypothetical protein [Polyangia bacterium]